MIMGELGVRNGTVLKNVPEPTSVILLFLNFKFNQKQFILTLSLPLWKCIVFYLLALWIKSCGVTIQLKPI